MARVLIAEPLADAGVELLRTAHEVDARASMTREELLGAIGSVDALVVRSATRVDAEVLEAGRDLKVVGRAGIGQRLGDQDSGHVLDATPGPGARTSSAAAACRSARSGGWPRPRACG